ncbi:MAG: hypothetical protein WDA22_01555 [Bacteroidota bacterium]
MKYIKILMLTIVMLHQNNISQSIKPLLLPTTLTEKNIVQILKQAKHGEYNNFEMIRKIAERKNDVIPILSRILKYKEPIVIKIDSIPVENDSVHTLISLKLYSIYILEVIGTPDVLNILSQSISFQQDDNVRGAIVNVFAHSYYERTIVAQPKTLPNKETIKLLLQFADDTSMVERFQKSIGKIAREGLLRWTEKDLGAVVNGKPIIIKIGTNKIEMTPKQYRDWWWKTYHSKLTWNSEKNLFYIKH